MNKSQLIKAVAEKSELSQKQIGETWKLFEQTILETLNAGDNVQLYGNGNYEVRERAERKGRNPKTGEEIQIGARRSPMFKPGKALKEAVEG